MLSVVKLNVAMLSVAMLNVVMLSVVAPSKQWLISCKHHGANSQNGLKCFFSCFVAELFLSGTRKISKILNILSEKI